MKHKQWHIWALLTVVIVLIIILFFWNKNIEMFETRDYLEGIDVIYWINLDRSKDRRKRMKKMFKDPAFNGKKIIRISAVDGKSPDIDQVLNANFDGMQPEKFTKVEYACTLSHLNAIKQFSESNDQVALIMEDDMTLEYKKYWKKSTKEIMNKAPNDWEIIQLCINSNTIPRKMYTKQKGDTYFSTGSYIINQTGAKKIINQKSKNILNNHIGHSADVYLYLMTNTYVYKYPYFTYKYKTRSTIHQNHEEIHNNNKRIIDGFIHGMSRSQKM
uniref:Glycosyl transferase family 25 domain-containing protein n=1 Tax=viral metagenome TaxID=1070528 RepID=A0A6C0B713_9ZZZZ